MENHATTTTTTSTRIQNRENHKSKMNAHSTGSSDRASGCALRAQTNPFTAQTIAQVKPKLLTYLQHLKGEQQQQQKQKPIGWMYQTKPTNPNWSKCNVVDFRWIQPTSHHTIYHQPPQGSYKTKKIQVILTNNDTYDWMMMMTLYLKQIEPDQTVSCLI